ncbi:uncharacterized protein LOC105697001 [Orussus abietinus]|uniref:uncharacterized protein LOC105697001 n=1 Tax=Orussus abietinus TaxID=222816 RepID=UPI00062541F2|nr:uncharacterized protein LOC105697001 [Orussus abietinus]
MTPSICAIFCVVLATHLVLAEEVALPSSVKTCKKDSEDYSSCLRLALQESWPTFSNGIPEFDLPRLDPYDIDFQESVYENGEVRGKVTVRDVKTYGLSKIRFLSVRPHHEEGRFRLEIDMEIPKSFIEGDYKATGALGTFVMGGKGYFNISMEGVRATWDLDGRVENDRWIVEHFTLLPEVRKMNIFFTDLFNGNQELNKAAMTFVNEYWPLLYHGMLPTVSKSWDEFLTNLANKVFSKISFSKTFP